MKLYLAGYSTHSTVARIPGAWYLLESYLTFVDMNKDFRDFHEKRGITSHDLFLDSGAFSAHSRGSYIDIDKYVKFIKRYEDLIRVYANLDVIGNWQATAENQAYMESHGLQPLPAFHTGSPMEELHRLCSQYDYIALGGLVPLARRPQKMRQWLDSCFSAISQYNRDGKVKRVHGFGVNAAWAWKRYPFYSVDATSWLTGGQYRRLVEFTGSDLRTYTKKGDRSVGAMKCCAGHYKELDSINAAEYLKMADYVTDLWEMRGVQFLGV